MHPVAATPITLHEPPLQQTHSLQLEDRVVVRVRKGRQVQRASPVTPAHPDCPETRETPANPDVPDTTCLQRQLVLQPARNVKCHCQGRLVSLDPKEHEDLKASLVHPVKMV